MQNNAAIASGQLWRLITPTFLHANVIHLLLNSTALNNLGPLVEAVSLPGRFLAVYTVAAVAAVTASYLGSPSVSLGASGMLPCCRFEPAYARLSEILGWMNLHSYLSKWVTGMLFRLHDILGQQDVAAQYTIHLHAVCITSQGQLTVLAC